MREMKVLNTAQILFLLKMHSNRNNPEFGLNRYDKYELERMYKYIEDGDNEMGYKTRIELNRIRKLYIENVLKK